MSVARKAGVAAGALFLRKCWSSILGLVVIGYLANSLEREAFGIVAIASVVFSIIQMLGVSGVSEYVIFSKGDEKESESEAVNAAFWFNFAASLAVVIAGCLVAPLIAKVYADPQLGPVILIMLPGFFSSMIASIPKAAYRKEIDYGPLVAVETIYLTVTSCGQLLLAWLGFGIYSLVLPGAVAGPIVAWTFLKKSPLRLGNTFGCRRWPGILAYTKHIIGARILTRLANEGDNLVIGKVLGTSALGTYYLAYRMSTILFISLTPVVVDVSMPVFSRTSDQRRLLFSRYSKMLSLIMFVMFPLLALLFVTAGPCSVFIYGSDMALLVQILIVGVIGRCVSSPSGGLFNATGRPQIPLYFVCVFTPIFLGILAATSRYGLNVAALTVALCFTVGQLVQTWLVSRIVFKSKFFRQILVQTLHYLAPAVIASAVTLWSLSLVDYEELIPEAVHGAAVVTVVYWLLFRLTSKKEMRRVAALFDTINPGLGRVASVLAWPGTEPAKRVG